MTRPRPDAFRLAELVRHYRQTMSEAGAQAQAAREAQYEADEREAIQEENRNERKLPAA